MRKEESQRSGSNRFTAIPRGRSRAPAPAEDGSQQLLTIAQAAEFLNVSKTSLRRWTNSELLKCYRIGNRRERRFLVDDLIAFMPSSTPEAQLPEAEEKRATPKELRPHLCTQYASSTEQWSLVRPHLLSHLDESCRVVYLYDQTEQHLHEWLTEEQLDTGLLLAAGQLRLIPAAQSYLKDGHFDRNRMLDFWNEVILAASRDGVERLLLSGEMAWATRGAPGSEELLQYESEFDQVLHQHDWVTVVCQYDLRAFSAEVVFRSLCQHPTVQLEDGARAGLG